MMIRFLFKGIIRDRTRSLFPVLIVAAGAFLTVLMEGYMQGAMGSMIDTTARFSTGHVKVITEGFRKYEDQIPNDLSLLDTTALVSQLEHSFPQLKWVPRIRFGGLLDVPDAEGNTRVQSPVTGMGLDIFNPASHDHTILNIKDALVQGRLPNQPNEMLVSEGLAERLALSVGDSATFLGSTADGGMAAYNFVLVGTIRFGMQSMDRGAIIADMSDMQLALNMTDSASEILGFTQTGVFDEPTTNPIYAQFNQDVPDKPDLMTPIMLRLRDQAFFGSYLDLAKVWSIAIIGLFGFVMSLVLLNSRLMGNLRRYGEIGVRLAIGESKGRVVGAMVVESLLLGVMGSALGTLIALPVLYYLQVVGFDISYATKNAALMVSDIIRAKITINTFYIGFVPGLIAPVLGTLAAGVGIFRRQTSRLFKELEV